MGDIVVTDVEPTLQAAITVSEIPIDEKRVIYVFSIVTMKPMAKGTITIVAALNYDGLFDNPDGKTTKTIPVSPALQAEPTLYEDICGPVVIFKNTLAEGCASCVAAIDTQQIEKLRKQWQAIKESMKETRSAAPPSSSAPVKDK